MNRRTMIVSFAALTASWGLAQAKATQPYRVSLIAGERDGANWRAGVAIDLAEGWKTYWRMPGEAGIPPQFDWSGSQAIADVSVLYPLPKRLQDLSGETVGYEGQVIFPVVVRLLSNAREASLQLNLFLAVCRNICIPAKAHASLALGSAAADTDRLEEWIKRVPVSGEAVRAVTATMDGDRPTLLITLARPARDIFVEAKGSAYFRKPVFSENGLQARLLVDNVQHATELKGLAVKLTVALDGSGIEQAATVE